MLNQLNINIFNTINHFAGNNTILDKFGIIIAEHLSIIFVLILIYLWFKKDEYKNVVLYSGYAAILGLALNYIITLFYFHPRPFMDNLGKLLIAHAPETSFPSDHTTFMLSIAFMLLYFSRTRKLGIALSLLGFIGGLARVFVGIHFPFDIIGSIFIAIFSAYVIFTQKHKLLKINELLLNSYNKILKRILKFNIGKDKMK